MPRMRARCCGSADSGSSRSRRRFELRTGMKSSYATALQAAGLQLACHTLRYHHDSILRRCDMKRLLLGAVVLAGVGVAVAFSGNAGGPGKTVFVKEDRNPV